MPDTNISWLIQSAQDFARQRLDVLVVPRQAYGQSQPQTLSDGYQLGVVQSFEFHRGLNPLRFIQAEEFATAFFNFHHRHDGIHVTLLDAGPQLTHQEVESI